MQTPEGLEMSRLKAKDPSGCVLLKGMKLLPKEGYISLNLSSVSLVEEEVTDTWGRSRVVLAGGIRHTVTCVCMCVCAHTQSNHTHTLHSSLHGHSQKQQYPSSSDQPGTQILISNANKFSIQGTRTLEEVADSKTRKGNLIGEGRVSSSTGN